MQISVMAVQNFTSKCNISIISRMSDENVTFYRHLVQIVKKTAAIYDRGNINRISHKL